MSSVNARANDDAQKCHTSVCDSHTDTMEYVGVGTDFQLGNSISEASCRFHYDRPCAYAGQDLNNAGWFTISRHHLHRIYGEIPCAELEEYGKAADFVDD